MRVDVALVKPPLHSVPDILTGVVSQGETVRPWRLQKKAVIDPLVGNCWPGDNLSLGYLGAYVRSRGYRAELIDAYLEDTSLESVVARLVAMEPRIIGVSVLQTETHSALKMVRLLRENGYDGHVTVGGHLPTFAAEILLTGSRDIDSAVIGEGEETLLQLCERLTQGDSVRDIPGLAYRSAGGIVCNRSTPSCIELDELPFPARDNHDLAEAKGYVYSVASSRGCDWAGCAFCSIHPFADSRHMPLWRGRSIRNVVEELLTLKPEDGQLRVNFTDENFLPDETGLERAVAFAEEVHRAQLELDFLISARVSSVEREVFSTLKNAGLSKVFLGVESGVDRLLKFYGKGQSAEQSLRAIRLLRSLGLTVFAGTIMFDPFSTFDEIVENYEFFGLVEQELGYFDMFRYSRKLQAYLGTPLWHRMSRDGLLSGDPLSGDYPLVNPKVRRLYASLVSFQEAALPCYDLIGRLWELDADSHDMKMRAQQFADVFHRYVRHAISCCAAEADSEDTVPVTRFVDDIKALMDDASAQGSECSR